MTQEPNAKKSPIKTPPLHDPGQSLRLQLDNVLMDQALPWMMFGVMGLLYAGLEWLRWAVAFQPNPFVVTALAVAIAGIATWKVVRAIPYARQLKLGYEGEKSVGQCLELFRAGGYQVIHDLPGNGFNVDHVLVGPGGVFAIETKTRMMPRGQPSEVVFDGEAVTVDGFEPDRDPIVQARAAARHVKEIVREWGGKDIQVRPVVLFPGWYTRTARGSDVWVLNVDAFAKWVIKEKATLDKAAIQQIATAIGAHVRANTKAP